MKYWVKFIKQYMDIQPSQNENKLKPLLKTELFSDRWGGWSGYCNSSNHINIFNILSSV